MGYNAAKMSLVSGARLGPYEILAPLGAGGMGEVYRARDSRLDRAVAIKILHSHLSENPDLRQRFEREARAVSSLNHPHICTLYDIGRQDGIDFLVMEYLEGETLADRLAKGPLPLPLVLRTAMEIADALDKAHRQGVVHRDLKPGNVMLTKSGAKLLDFGLAKLKDAGPGKASPMASALPTQSKPLTAEGGIPGTLQYMAPEQLEGQEVDSRTDLFALGEIIYEMTTRRRPFEGKSPASLIAAILSSEPPPIADRQPLAPPALDRLARRCLAKDPEDRWQTARDVVLELKSISVGTAAAGPSPPGAWHRRNRERLIWLGALLALAAALGIASLGPRGPDVDTRSARFTVSFPEGAVSRFTRVSPDGRHISATAASGGISRIWLRPLNATSARPLPGTEGAGFHFWSPDSRFIGFIAGGKLMKIDIKGGLPLALCDAPGSGPFQLGAWSSRGTILFRVDEAPGHQEGLFEVSEGGGVPKPLTIRDEKGEEVRVVWLSFLPDGGHFLALCEAPEGGATCVASLDSGKARRLLNTASYAVYSRPGYVVYVQGGSLVAQEFDPGKLELSGEPVRIVDRFPQWGDLGPPYFSVSDTGVLVYQFPGGQSRLVWRDRKGMEMEQVGSPAAYAYRSIRLAPGSRKLAAAVEDPKTQLADIWIIDLDRNVGTRFTSDAQDFHAAL
ncbi:MAG: WD40 repeat domain-containing serine/threonine protein kinase, partial [Acidobacteria bacterium]|nr:WD40 repeat domain-containing serine/threonine protein kinase [Acidobacteriota bacterium]